MLLLFFVVVVLFCFVCFFFQNYWKTLIFVLPCVIRFQRQSFYIQTCFVRLFKINRVIFYLSGKELLQRKLKFSLEVANFRVFFLSCRSVSPEICLERSMSLS